MRGFVWGVVVLAVVAIAGCGSKDGRVGLLCQTDQQCPNGLSCEAGVCQSLPLKRGEVDADAEMPPGQTDSGTTIVNGTEPAPVVVPAVVDKADSLQQAEPDHGPTPPDSTDSAPVDPADTGNSDASAPDLAEMVSDGDADEENAIDSAETADSGTDADKPDAMPDVDEPDATPDVDEPDATPDVDEPDATPDVDEPDATPDVDEPDVDEPDATPAADTIDPGSDATAEEIDSTENTACQVGLFSVKLTLDGQDQQGMEITVYADSDRDGQPDDFCQPLTAKFTDVNGVAAGIPGTTPTDPRVYAVQHFGQVLHTFRPPSECDAMVTLALISSPPKSPGTYGWTRTFRGYTFEIGQGVQKQSSNGAEPMLTDLAVDSAQRILMAGSLIGKVNYGDDPDAVVCENAETNPFTREYLAAIHRRESFVTLNSDKSSAMVRSVFGDDCNPPAPPFPADVRALKIARDAADNVVILGDTDYNNGARGIWIAKFTKQGELLWSRRVVGAIGSTPAFETLNLGLDAAGAIFVSAQGRGRIQFKNVDAWTDAEDLILEDASQPFVFRVTPSGGLSWQRVVHTYQTDGTIARILGMAVAPSGSLIFTGQFSGQVVFDFDAATPPPGPSTPSMAMQGYLTKVTLDQSDQPHHAWTKLLGKTNTTIGDGGVAPLFARVAPNGDLVLGGQFIGCREMDPAGGQPRGYHSKFAPNGFAPMVGFGFVTRLTGDGQFRWSRVMSTNIGGVPVFEVDPKGNAYLFALESSMYPRRLSTDLDGIQLQPYQSFLDPDPSAGIASTGRLARFDNDGVNLSVTSLFTLRGFGSFAVYQPTGLAVDDAGNVTIGGWTWEDSPELGVIDYDFTDGVDTQFPPVGTEGINGVFVTRFKLD